MATKITRKTAKQFAGSATAGPNGIAQFGSLAASAPAYSTDPAVIQGLSQWLGGWNTALVGGASPAAEDVNAVDYVASYQLGYLLQQGIAEWDSGTYYFINSFVSYNGQTYISLTNSNLNNTPTAGSNWALYGGLQSTGVFPFSSGTTYSINQLCSYNGLLYVSLQNANLNQTPALGSAYWTLISSSTKGENAIRNGSMSIAQRGTSGTITASTPGYTLDGWIVDSVGANTAWSQVYYGPSKGFNLKLVPAGTLTDLYVKQRIESTQMSQVGYQNQTFQALITNNTGASITPTLALNVPTAADNYGSVTQILAPTNLQTIANGASAVVSYTFSGLSTADANGLEVILDFSSSVPSGGNVLITNVDVSPTPAYTTGLNNNPPSYKSRFVATELVNCQRYFVSWGGNSTSENIFLGASATSSSSGSSGFMVPLPVQMRAFPAISYSALSDFMVEPFFEIGTGYTPQAFNVGSGGTYGVGGLKNISMEVPTSGSVTGTIGLPVVLTVNGTLAARFNLSAEL